MKTIYFLRHGAYLHNEDLSPEGIAEITLAAEQIKADLLKEGINKTVLHYSPQRRAIRSAAWFSSLLAPVAVTAKLERLLNSEAKQVAEVVSRAEPYSILLSHQPDLENYLGLLLKTGEWVKRTV